MFGLFLLPISRASFSFLFLFPVITLVFQTARMLASLMFFLAGYLAHKLPLLTRPLWMLTSYEKPGSRVIPMISWLKAIDSNIYLQANWNLLCVSKTSESQWLIVQLQNRSSFDRAEFPIARHFMLRVTQLDGFPFRLCYSSSAFLASFL